MRWRMVVLELALLLAALLETRGRTRVSILDLQTWRHARDYIASNLTRGASQWEAKSC